MEPTVIKINRHTKETICSPKFVDLKRETELNDNNIITLMIAKQNMKTNFVETENYVYMYVAENLIKRQYE